MNAVIGAPPAGYAALNFSGLSGWVDEDHAAALRVFLHSAALAGLPVPTDSLRNPRQWFESQFRPLLVCEQAHLTGYFEPEIAAALARTARFSQPIYAMPAAGSNDFSRAQIDAGALAGTGLEMAWIADAADAFLMQVQGCGRLRLPDGLVLRIGYAGSNGHRYRSVGTEMVRRGLVAADKISASVIRGYVTANPDAGRELLQHNESFVFFRTMSTLRPGDGPMGNLGTPVTPRRSVAVDPACIPLGLPVWIETLPLSSLFDRLAIAQDVGGAIRGPARADLFFGTGIVAGEAAGQFSQSGRMVVLWPKAAL